MIGAKWIHIYICLIAQSCPALCDPMVCSPPGSSVHVDRRVEYWSSLPCLLLLHSPGDLPNPGAEPRSPTLQANSLPSEPPGKSKNTEVGRLSLLQGNFLTHGMLQMPPRGCFLTTVTWGRPRQNLRCIIGKPFCSEELLGISRWLQIPLNKQRKRWLYIPAICLWLFIFYEENNV